MIGLWVVLVAGLLALAFGGYRALTDGRARTTVADDGTALLDGTQLGAPLAGEATFVQFSSRVCAPCRSTHALLADVTQDLPAVGYIDIDAESRLDLVERFGITRTPTVLLVDGGGAVRHRMVGAARRSEVLQALDEVALGPRD